MGKPRQRQQSELIVKSKRNWVNEVMISVSSLLLWIYCIVVILFFIGSLFNYNNEYMSLIKMSFKMTNEDIRHFLFLIIAILLTFITGLWVWKYYNAKKFGSFTRRKYPLDTTEEELLALGLMKKEDYLLLQEAKAVTFEKNPIREL